MLAGIHSPSQNDLLKMLSADVQKRIFPYLEIIELPLGKVLCESGELLRYVYFPTTCIVSLLNVLEDSSSAEISVVGDDGIVGVSVFMGGGSSTSRAVVQSSGFAYRLLRRRILDEFNRHGELMLLVLRYIQALFTQMAQTAVCNRHHHIEEQLCRWLLVSLDLVKNNHLVMTQELIANMLGVRREGVTEAAGHLHKQGVINYSRGHIVVTDRAKLERLSCECYRVVKTETERLMHYSGNPPQFRS
ncbi:Crp/Fnr family transcriptional regulator [Pseudidiomarina sp. E22-M8]|uniref:Crp/Fnr family transcriptional regulator n=1 Tax=Pseudidiomarina sp. E22-M8 TaxID=3424768 RepID=UPI00403CE764